MLKICFCAILELYLQYEFKQLIDIFMKKLFLFVALFATTALSVVSCNKNGGDAGIEISGDSKLTPGEHKARMEEIAIDFIDSFNVNDVEELVYELYDLADYLEWGDFPDYYGEMMNNLARGAEELSIVELGSFVTRATEDFVIDINDPDLNPYAGHSYTFNEDWYEWTEGQANSNTIEFIWNHAKATLKWSGEKKVEFEYPDEDINYVVYVPKTITLTVTIDGVEHLVVTVNPNITSSNTMAPSTEVRLYGGYVIKVSGELNNKGVGHNASIEKNGKSLYSSVVAITVDDFNDVDNWLKECNSDDYYGYYAEIDPDFFKDNLKNGTVQINIMELTLYAKGDFRGVIEEIEKIDAIDDEKKFYKKLCDLVNDKVKAVALYNDTNERVADVVMQVASDDGWDGLEYYVEPILLFPDGSKYAFEDYFTEHAFGDLIDRIEEIVEELEDYDLI